MIILDLEWNRGYDKTPLEEIVQIGAVRLDKLGGRILDTFCVFVHPCVHRKFNRTAKALPELHSALSSPHDFPAALALFTDWCSGDTVFADWGGDDFDVLRANCEFWKVPAPVPSRLIDLQLAFSLRVGTNQGVALYRAVEYCGIPATFTFHNALNDAVYTALITDWLSDDILALTELPKEIRRLNDTPDFPPQVPRPVSLCKSPRAALNEKNCRRQSCPVCGDGIWIRRWFPGEENSYYADFRCKTHGSFLCRLSLSPAGDEQWQGMLSIPKITPELLQDFDKAIQRGAIPCKPGKRRKFVRNRRRNPSRAPQNP